MTSVSLDNNINVPLLLREHLPTAIRATKTRIAKLEQQVAQEKQDLETLIKHAAVANITVEEPSAPEGAT